VETSGFNFQFDFRQAIRSQTQANKATCGDSCKWRGRKLYLDSDGLRPIRRGSPDGHIASSPTTLSSRCPPSLPSRTDLFCSSVQKISWEVNQISCGKTAATMSRMAAPPPQRRLHWRCWASSFGSSPIFRSMFEKYSRPDFPFCLSMRFTAVFLSIFSRLAANVEGCFLLLC